jgi:hypothetical protein
LLCWYIVYSLPFSLFQYVWEIYPFPFHKVSKIMIFRTYLPIFVCSCMVAFPSLVSPSIGIALHSCSFLLLGLSMDSFVICSLASLDFTDSFPPSAPLLVLSHPFVLFLAFGFLPVGVFLCFLLALFMWFSFINPSSSYCGFVLSTYFFLLRGYSLIRCPCS